MYIGFYVKYSLFLSDVNENPSSGSRVVPCKRTDTLNEDKSRFSQFCERAKCESCIMDEWMTVWFDGWLAGDW
jgi:hypothetical protein